MTTGDGPVVLVTGAGGYLGGHVVAGLAATTSVRALTRDVAHWLDDLDVVTADLLDDDLAPACKGIDTVVHLAGHDEVRFADDPDRAYDETVRATERVAAAAVAAGATRLVYVSTVHVYGAALAGGGVVTEDASAEPTGRYAEARLASEAIVQAAVAPVVLRLTNAVGPPVAPEVSRWTLVANDLSRQAVRTGELRLRTPGTQWRDFIGMDDVRRAVVAAATATPAGTYNLAAGQPRTILDLAGLVQDAYETRTGIRPRLHAPDADSARPEPCTVDPGRLRATGWAPRQPLPDAIMQTVDACLDWKDDLRE